MLKLSQELTVLNKLKNNKREKLYIICSKLLCLENIKYMNLVFTKYILLATKNNPNPWSYRQGIHVKWIFLGMNKLG